MKRYGIRNWAGVGPPERVEREFRKGGRRYFDDRPRPSRQREQSDFMRRSVETLRGEARAGSESRPRRERGSRNATPLPNCLRNSSTVSVGDVSRGYQGGERYGSPPAPTRCEFVSNSASGEGSAAFARSRSLPLPAPRCACRRGSKRADAEASAKRFPRRREPFRREGVASCRRG